jgi:hypothetical protein
MTHASVTEATLNVYGVGRVTKSSPASGWRPQSDEKVRCRVIRHVVRRVLLDGPSRMTTALPAH